MIATDGSLRLRTREKERETMGAGVAWQQEAAEQRERDNHPDREGTHAGLGARAGCTPVTVTVAATVIVTSTLKRNDALTAQEPQQNPVLASVFSITLTQKRMRPPV